MSTRARREQWEQLGWLHFPAALDVATIARLDEWLREVEHWGDTGGPGLHHFEQTANGPRIARSEDFDPHHAPLSAFLRSGRVSAIVAEVLDEPGLLFKEKVNYKHSGGAGFAAHQDATAYRFCDHHVSVLVPIDPMTTRSGCLHFAPVERDTILAHQAGRIDPDWVAAASWTPVEAEPGDLVVFDSYTPHHSGMNESDQPRRALYLTYNGAGEGDQRQRYYDHKYALLADVDNAAAERVRISVNDDFLGLPVEHREARTATR